MGAMQRVIVGASALAMAAGTSVIAPPAYAQQRQLSFDIKAQPLGQALRALGRQARIELVFDEAAFGSRHSSALTGSMTIDAALDRILQGTDLKVTRTSNGVYAISGGSGHRAGCDDRLPASRKRSASRTGWW